MRKLSITLICLSASFWAQSQSYDQYMQDVLENSFAVKIAQKDIAAEEERLKAREKFYLPTLGVAGSYDQNYRPGNAMGNKNTGQVTATLASRLYSSDVKNKISEADFKLKIAQNTLDTERERLSADVLKALINISYYKELQQFSQRLNNEAKSLTEQIRNQVALGTASENDISRASLLVSKIDKEITAIDKQIKLSISNIEAVTGIMYPEDGITIDYELQNRIKSYVADETSLVNNLSYVALNYQKEMAFDVMKQQNPWLTVDFSLEQLRKHVTENGVGAWADETKVMLSANINLFDYSKQQEVKAQLEGIESAMLKMDMRMHELKNSLSTFTLYENSFIEEQLNLEFQIIQTDKLVQSHVNEYAVGKVSLYEMMNTRFDLFTAIKQKIDVDVEFMQNKVDMMQNSGQLL